ncbi:hypothetical protein L0U85_00575 [Glycomyces sp. L485]|uniref:hypothetical protein n=1 Tax=Glycomyces sp. L485 TaxID=2909235 RepID=UPI001F4B8020|nr:hypothetical protein [Glycomyces sp. L485]MCH7229363.1 hypothetical protein [Glycomyces sp. L485]
MRTALRIIFSRYGIVVIIVLLVVGALALTQGREDFPLSSGGSDDGSSASDSPSQELTVDDGITVPECEGDECDGDDSPLHDPYEDEGLPDEAVEKALEFAEAWIGGEGKDANSWFQSMQPYLTEKAAELMRGVDPSGVPAAEITGEAETDGGEVLIPMDTGTLILTMIEGDNSWASQAWLVSAIDWEAA